MGETLVDRAVAGVQDAVTLVYTQGGNLFDLTCSAINELHENAGDFEVFDTLLRQVVASPPPLTVDAAMAALRQAVTYAIEVDVPWQRCKRILYAVFHIQEPPRW
jgi:hypothetical protein